MPTSHRVKSCLYAVTEGPLIPVPLKSVTCHAEIKEIYSVVTVNQVYSNTSSKNIEAHYVFPVDNDASIYEFTAKVGQTVLVGSLKLKDQAKKEYNDAVREGKFAALMEEITGDALKATVGNIKPGEEVTISYKYVTELSLVDESYRFVFPTYVAERYTPAKDLMDGKESGFSEIKYDNSVKHKAEITANIVMSEPINTVTSGTHKFDILPVSVNNVQLKMCDTFLDSDVTVLIKTSSLGKLKVLQNYQKEKSELVLGLHTVVKFPESENKSKNEYIFVVDRSGSMEDKCSDSTNKLKIDATVEMLLLLIKSLPVDCYFDIVGFGSDYKSMFGESKLYSRDTVAKAEEEVKQIKADLGGTELMAPMMHILNKKPIEGYARQVYVLTDGQVSNTDEIIKYTSKNIGGNRIFTVGIGNGVSHELVDGLAKSGKGSARYTVDCSDLNKIVVAQLRESLKPYYTHVKVDWGMKTVMQSPSNVNTVSDDGTTVYAICEVSEKEYEKVSEKSVVFTAYSSDRKEHTFSVKLNNFENTHAVKLLAVRNLIRDLEEGRKDDKDGVEKTVTKLSLDNNIMSRYTSFVLINHNDPVNQTPIEKVQVPSYGRNESFMYGMSMPMAAACAPSSRICAAACAAPSMMMCDSLESACDIEPQSMMYKSAPAKAKKVGFLSSIASKMKSVFSIAPAIVTPVKEKVEAKVVTEKDKTLDVLQYQDPLGSFKLTDEVLKSIGLDKSKIKSLQSKYKSLSDDAFATTLVMVYLNLKASAYADEISMILDKAKDWLTTEKMLNTQLFTEAQKLF